MDQNRAKNWYVLKVDAEKCIGCRLCELVCSLKYENEICPSNASMRIITENDLSYPITCSQCLDAPCEQSCERKAIYRNRNTGYLKIDKWGCNQCGLCITECPFGMLRMGKDSVIKCDLCGGDPECVKVCPTEAIQLVKRFKTNLDTK